MCPYGVVSGISSSISGSQSRSHEVPSEVHEPRRNEWMVYCCQVRGGFTGRDCQTDTLPHPGYYPTTGQDWEDMVIDVKPGFAIRKMHGVTVGTEGDW